MTKKKIPFIWMVQYNLAGLQKPYELSYTPFGGGDGSWYDSTGNVGCAGSNNIKFTHDKIPDTYESRDLVQYFFATEKEAFVAYEMLNRYRKHIKNHI